MLHYDHVIFDSNSEVPAEDIRTQKSGDSEFIYFSSILSMLSLFSNFEIKFIRQQVNMITQTVVRVAIC
jgi:hypothetical protein